MGSSITFKKSIILIFIPSLFLSSGCFPSWDEPPIDLYLKVLPIKDAEVNWYYHSLITSRPPDWVVIKYNDGFIDTICQAENISAVAVHDTVVKITFHHYPTFYRDPTNVKEVSRGFKIVVDTKGKRFSDSARSALTFERDRK